MRPICTKSVVLNSKKPPIECFLFAQNLWKSKKPPTDTLPICTEFVVVNSKSSQWNAFYLHRNCCCEYQKKQLNAFYSSCTESVVVNSRKKNNWMLSICTDSMEKRKAPNWTIGRAKTCLTAEEAIREPILVTDQRTRPSYLYFLKMISMSYYLAHISFCLGLGIYSYSTSLSRRWTLSFQLDLCGKLPLSISFKSN